MNKRRKTVISLFIAIAIAVIFVANSCIVYDRSAMATLSEFYMIAIDRDKIYEAGTAYEEHVKKSAAVNIKNYTKPSGVKMSVPYYSVHQNRMQVFHFNPQSYTDTIIVYIPGGGYLNQPLKYHWKVINRLASETDSPVVMPIYLKVPNHTCEESYEAMTEFYLELTQAEGLKNVIFVGDSSGGAMALSLAQQLRDNHPEAIQPKELMLIAPWMDVSMENEKILDIEPIDPMLGLHGTIDLGKKWAGGLDVHNPIVSPIYGSFDNLGYISIFIGTKDMLYPDNERFSEILTSQGIEHTYIVEEGLDHPYPLFPTPEAADAQDIMIERINNVKYT